jgi:hypothetical protein
MEAEEKWERKEAEDRRGDLSIKKNRTSFYLVQ